MKNNTIRRLKSWAKGMHTQGILFSFCVFAGILSSCVHEGPDGGTVHPENCVFLALNVDESEVRDANGLRATADENVIEDLMVFLFAPDAAGALYPNGRYEFSKSEINNKTKWENENTMLIPLAPEDVQNKRVVVVANYKGKGSLENQLKNVQAYSGLQALLYESATASAAITAPRLLMEGEVTHTFSKANRKAVVHLRRAVAKVTVNIQFAWEALNATLTNQNFYQFRDVARDTYIMEKKGNVLTSANRTPFYNNNNATADHLWPFAPASSPKAPLTISVYLNEYDQGQDATNVPPYLYLKLHAKVAASNSGDTDGGVYPPPAGGEVTKPYEKDYYYRLLLPRKVERNTHYVLEAQILSAGSDDAQKPQDIKTKVTVVGWTEVRLDQQAAQEILN